MAARIISGGVGDVRGSNIIVFRLTLLSIIVLLQQFLLLLLLLLLSFCTSSSALIFNGTVGSCSNTCESQNCDDPFDLRYGKYCGIGYTGCSGAVPCDGLDRCCMVHDRCIGSQLTNYLNKTCNSNLRSCIEAFKNSGNATFAGANCSASDVETVAITAMDIATGSTGFSPPMPFSFGWVTLSVCGLSVLLLLWPSLMVNQFRS
ncbi:hypothetical protein BDL97_02G022800 [Sphagnum fallax]|nr:hypothetical protein BDL97_02G022800 [Sphagnum fallax]